LEIHKHITSTSLNTLTISLSIHMDKRHIHERQARRGQRWRFDEIFLFFDRNDGAKDRVAWVLLRECEIGGHEVFELRFSRFGEGVAEASAFPIGSCDVRS
jgi:hypothetical protein